MKFNITTEYFDGPIDLLLHLVQKKKLDITVISIANIADEYISYLNNAEFLNLEQATEFLDVATVLVRIKIRSVFPRDSVEDIEDDPADLLIQLMNKKYYSVLADMMVQWEDLDLGYFKKGKVDYDYKGEVDSTELLDEVTLLNLAIIFENTLKNLEEKDEIVVESYKLTVADQILWIQKMCRNQAVQLKDMFTSLPDKFSVVVSFLALLECMRLGKVIVISSSLDSCLIIGKEEVGEIENR